MIQKRIGGRLGMSARLLCAQSVLQSAARFLPRVAHTRLEEFRARVSPSGSISNVMISSRSRPECSANFRETSESGPHW